MPAVPVMAQPAKVATPAVAVTGSVVHANVPPGLVPMARVIGAEAVVTTVLPEFSILTTGCPLKVTPLTVLPGVVVKTSFRFPVMLKLLDVTEVSPVLVAISVKPPAAPVISQPAKVAMPDTAVTGLVVQLSVPVPEAMDRVTEADEPVTTAPLAFSTWTTGWALNVTPLAVEPGVVEKASLVAAVARTSVWVAVAELVP